MNVRVKESKSTENQNKKIYAVHTYVHVYVYLYSFNKNRSAELGINKPKKAINQAVLIYNLKREAASKEATNN